MTVAIILVLHLDNNVRCALHYNTFPVTPFCAAAGDHEGFREARRYEQPRLAVEHLPVPRHARAA